MRHYPKNDGMTTDDNAPGTKRRRVLDIMTVVTLSITAVLTAWCGFEASKWGGEMSIAFSQASSARVQAASAEATAQAARQYDLTIYAEWIIAERNGDVDLMNFIEERFTEEFAIAFSAWKDGGRTERGPLAMAEYVPPGTTEAQELSERADSKFEEALVNNQRGDNYSLLTVLFALVLFFAALSQAQRLAWRRHTFLGLAVALGVVGAVILATFPVKI